uniref:Uncharacterized protein n=1 Tax=Staphylococcus aureus TaxID=1280 RepID=D2JKP1_STAAU|nr:hypothetical protein SAP030A_038 [Staphylococcus aureus]
MYILHIANTGIKTYPQKKPVKLSKADKTYKKMSTKMTKPFKFSFVRPPI